MREAGQPTPVWSDGLYLPGQTAMLPLGVSDHEEYWALYRQALIVCGILPAGYYDELDTYYPVGPRSKWKEPSR